VRTFVLTVAAALSLATNLLLPTSAMAQSTTAPYIFVAAPRENAARGERDYGPIASFLSHVLHHPVVYEHPNGWLTYETWIWTDHADIYFDGPQFVAWRINHLDQTLGPRIPQPQDWRLYTRKGSTIHNLQQVSTGAILCAPPLPNFGTLWVMSLFTNPSRQPYIRNTHGWKKIFKDVMDNKCQVGIGPRLTLHYLSSTNNEIKVFKRSVHYPNQGFSISAALPLAVRTAIVQALLSPEGEQAMMRLRKRFAHGRELVLGGITQYAGIEKSLDAQWGTVYATGINRDLKQDAKRENLTNVHLIKP